MSDKIKVSFQIERPKVPATDEQIAEYLRYWLGETASLSADNPLRGTCVPIAGKVIIGDPQSRKPKPTGPDLT